MHKLSDSTGVVNEADDILVDGNDVYVAGQVTENRKVYVAYWKNGLKTIMGEGWLTPTGNHLSVYNGNVYIAGFINSTGAYAPVYWKNTTMVSLSGLPRQYAKANSIVVNQNGVYVAGTLNSQNGTSTAVFWKDNVATLLAPDAKSSYASNIMVQGDEVYITGVWEKPLSSVDVYWKNGISNQIQSLNSFTNIVGISISGNDVYLAGFDVINSVTRATIWKNGTEIFNSPTAGGHETDIAVDGSNIYFLDSALGAGYWENGIIKKIQGPAKSSPRRIFVVHHN